MDHIPIPSEPANDPLIVPYYIKSAHEYDGQDFGSFVERCGFVIDDEYGLLWNADESSISLEDGLSIVQSWLFFGVIEGAAGSVGVEIERTGFIKLKAQGCEVITIENLPLITHLIAASFGDWRDSKEKPIDKRVEWFAYISSVVEVVPSLIAKWQAESDLFYDRTLTDAQRELGRVPLLSNLPPG